MVHQRRFWGNTRGLSADLGGGPKQVEKTHSNRLKKYHAERRCQKRWGRLAIRGPFRCKHRIKHRKRRPGHQGPRLGVSLPGHDRWGRLAIRGPFRCKHRIKHRKRRPGHQGPRLGVSLPGHDRWGRLAIRGPFRCKHRIKHRKRRPGHQGPRLGVSLPGHDRWGRLAILGPFRCKHRIKLRKRGPGHQGPRVGPACPATTSPATRSPAGWSGMSWPMTWISRPCSGSSRRWRTTLGVGYGFAIWGPFGVRASDACSRSTRCEDGSQLARRQPVRSVTEEKSIEFLFIEYDKIRNVVPNCQKKCHESMCQNGQDELPRAVGSTRMRTDRVLGRCGSSPGGSRPGSAESCARSRTSIRIRRVFPRPGSLFSLKVRWPPVPQRSA